MYISSYVYYIYMAGPVPELDWGDFFFFFFNFLYLQVMDNFNKNKIQVLMQEQDELLKKKKNKNKKRESRNISSSCVISPSTGSSGGSSSSSSKGEGGGVMKLSTDPQSVAARQRRHRISDKFKMLRSLIPGGGSNKMDTVSMLEEAIHYVKFLKTQLWLHHNIMMNSISNNPQEGPISSSDHDDLFLNSIVNFISSDSSPTTNAHVNNMINNLSLSSSSPPPPPPVQYPPHQFLCSSSSSPTTSSTTYNITPAAAATGGISEMPPVPPPVVPITTTLSPIFCYDQQGIYNN